VTWTTVRPILILWLAWLAAVLVFQAAVGNRFTIERPDRVLEWTPSDTSGHDPEHEPTLTDPFLNTQVAFDSEYYLSIATVGYDDPLPGVMRPPGGGEDIPLNYAFFPAYPLAIRAVAAPLSLLGMTPVATATLAGVVISALGALGAMLALADLVRDRLGEREALRTAFYLLIFPTGFFLAQVYTEGLFLGLSFGSLALARRGHLGWAAVLAAPAVWTRGIGVLLVVPLAWAWLSYVRASRRTDASLSADSAWRRLPWRRLASGAWVLLPLAAFLAWRISPLGDAFTTVEERYFGRRLFWIDASLAGWARAWESIFGAQPQTSLYYTLEFAAAGIGLVASIIVAWRYPELAVYSALVLLVSMTVGYPQSVQRYVLAMPAIFLALGQLGGNAIFDRSWTVVSLLWMGLLVTLYSFGFWVA
jgi:hypothetical protein